VTVLSHDPAPENALYRVALVPTTSPIAGHQSAPFTFPFQVAKQDFSGFNVIHAQGDEQMISRRSPPVVRTMHGSALAEAIHNGWRQCSPKRFFMHLYFYVAELVADLRADAVIAVSRDTSRYYPKVYGVIPNGVDLEHYSTLQGEKTTQPTILFVGELDSRKRGRLLLDSFRERVRRLLTDAELWLVCPEKVEGEGIRWLGNVNGEVLARLYREAWVFCLPSSYEGFGRPYIEAMAAGTPVVATPNAGAMEILDNGRFGLIVSEEHLGETLVKLLTDADLRERLSKSGLDRATVYSWERVAEQYEHVYENVLKRRSPA